MRILRHLAALVLVLPLLSTGFAADSAPLADSYPGDSGLAGDAAVVFSEDFESGHLKRWDDYDGNPAPSHQIVSDPGPMNRAGNLAVRLRVASGQRATRIW